MTNTEITVTTSPVGKGRPNYFNVKMNEKCVCEIKYPSMNLPGKSLQEVAEIQIKRILS